MGETPKTALVHHLSRTMTAITTPRQPDGAFKGANAFAPQPLDFTGNFFPRESHGTNASCSSTETAKTALAYVFGILKHLCTLEILPTKLFCRTLYLKLSRCANCTKLQQFIARFYGQSYYTTLEILTI